MILFVFKSFLRLGLYISNCQGQLFHPNHGRPKAAFYWLCIDTFEVAWKTYGRQVLISKFKSWSPDPTTNYKTTNFEFSRNLFFQVFGELNRAIKNRSKIRVIAVSRIGHLIRGTRPFDFLNFQAQWVFKIVKTLQDFKLFCPFSDQWIQHPQEGKVPPCRLQWFTFHLQGHRKLNNFKFQYFFQILL